MLPQFVFLHAAEFKGFELILETFDPYEIYRVYKFENRKWLDNFLLKYNLGPGDYTLIDGYNIIICYVGTINRYSGTPILGHNLKTVTRETFNELAVFYDVERITGNETRLKKFKTVINGNR